MKQIKKLVHYGDGVYRGQDTDGNWLAMRGPMSELKGVHAPHKDLTWCYDVFVGMKDGKGVRSSYINYVGHTMNNDCYDRKVKRVKDIIYNTPCIS